MSAEARQSVSGDTPETGSALQHSRLPNYPRPQHARRTPRRVARRGPPVVPHRQVCSEDVPRLPVRARGGRRVGLDGYLGVYVMKTLEERKMRRLVVWMKRGMRRKG